MLRYALSNFLTSSAASTNEPSLPTFGGRTANTSVPESSDRLPTAHCDELVRMNVSTTRGRLGVSRGVSNGRGRERREGTYVVAPLRHSKMAEETSLSSALALPDQWSIDEDQPGPRRKP